MISKNVYLRNVEENDRELLFEWANDEVVRQNSFSITPINFAEHSSWFDKMMKDKDCAQWILRVDEEDVAQIRVNIDGSNALVGYSVDSKRRGEGFGTLILQLASQRVKKEYPFIKKIIAQVKPDNIASLKALEASGYSVKFEQLELNIADL